MSKKKNNIYEVDISKLHGGKVYKNYKALVTEQGWKYYRPASKSGIAQKKQLDAVCRWGYETDSFGNKISNKVIIHEVYDKQLTIVDQRQWRENGIVSNLMVGKLLTMLKEQYLSQQKVKIGLSPLEWALLFGLCPQKFIDFRVNPIESSKKMGIKLEHTFDFLDNSYANIRHRLNGTFERLERIGLISYTTEIQLKYDGLNHYSETTKNQTNFIKKIEDEFLKTTPTKVLWSSYHNGVGRNLTLYKKIVEEVKKTALKSTEAEIRALSTIERYKTVIEVEVVSEELIKWWLGDETKLDTKYLERFFELSDSPYEDINKSFMDRLLINASLRIPTSIEEATEVDLSFRRLDADYKQNIETLIKTYIKVD